MAGSESTSAIRRLIAGNTVSAVGTGFVLPLVLIYLHRVRHIPLTTTGLLMAIPGVVGLVVIPIAGIVIDRIGAQRVLAGSLALLAVAEFCLAHSHTAGAAAVSLFLRGVALGPSFPAFNSALGSLVDGRAQQRAFAINFTLLNAGIGIGGIVGSTIIDVHHPATFQLMFYGNAVASLLAAGFVLTARSPARRRADAKAATTGGYRQILADPPLRRMVLVAFLLAMCGYAALDSGLPAYANVVAGASARVVALGLAANTLIIVIVQLPVLRLLKGRRRTLSLAIVGVIWSASWVLFGLAALPGSGAARDAIVIAFAALFGFGETFMAPTFGSLLNALAPDALRGRANSLTGGMYSIAFIVSPAVSAGFIALGLGGVWIALLSAGCLGVIVVAVRMRALLTPAQDIAVDGADHDDAEPIGSAPLESAAEV